MLEEEDCESDSKRVIIPILPININEISIHFEPAESSGVRFIESPTVPNAEKHSKTIRRSPSDPSIRKIAKEPSPIRVKDTTIIEKALFTEYS
jgi:hypothetical protein